MSDMERTTSTPAMVDVQARLEEINDLRRDADDQERQVLQACGWKNSSALPGSLWLWSKSFPESKTQWRWKPGSPTEREPNPPFTVNGATTKVALEIEASWQELWDDNRPTDDCAASKEADDAGE